MQLYVDDVICIQHGICDIHRAAELGEIGLCKKRARRDFAS